MKSGGGCTILCSFTEIPSGWDTVWLRSGNFSTFFWRDQSQIFPFFPKHTLGRGERFLFYTDFKSREDEKQAEESRFSWRLVSVPCPTTPSPGSRRLRSRITWLACAERPDAIRRPTRSLRTCAQPASSFPRFRWRGRSWLRRHVVNWSWVWAGGMSTCESVKEGSERGWMLPFRVSRGTESQVGRKGEGGGSEKQDR